nr:MULTISPECIES: adenosine deaminase [unclassified Streptomyces]
MLSLSAALPASATPAAPSSGAALSTAYGTTASGAAAVPAAGSLAGASFTGARVPTSAEARTDAYLRSVREQPARLGAFFRSMPKGGELHNHLSGAVSTEYLITLGAEDGLCVETATMTAVASPCGPGTRPLADARADRALHDALIRAWSMQDFPSDRSGHDHFFDTFGKFGEVSWRHRGKMLAEFADGIAAQNQSYLETMVSPASESAKKLAGEVGWDPDLDALYRKLTSGGRLEAVVTEAVKEADEGDAEFRAAARCGTAHPRPACGLTVRWISQVSRGSSPERVFTQLALGMRLAERDGRFVAVNLVQPEDWDSSLQNYRLQMRMIAYLRGVHPKAHVTLHAGELWPGLVKPEDLSFHITDAVGTARAERVGHGVGLVHETGWQDTARTMAARETAVEVPFSSNAQILGVREADHPFATYRAYGVPVVLATDDPGVSRIDITHEYQYAAGTYALSYPELKDLARASLEYAFVPGESLWRGNPTAEGYRTVPACRSERPGAPIRSTSCRRLIEGSPKASLEWRQESAFATFEADHRTR